MTIRPPYAALALALALTGCNRLTHTRVYHINSASMEPTLRIDDRVACSTKLPAAFRRGQVVAFHMPDGPDPKASYVKRVIGIGGDTLTSKDGNHWSVNGVPLDEPYIQVTGGGIPDVQSSVTVPRGEYFVMGDNRARSSDSRNNGPILYENVVAVCVDIVKPRKRAGRIAGT